MRRPDVLLPFACLLLACALPAAAESLNRCIARDGAVSYQALPCATTARLDRVVEYRPDPVATRAQEYSERSLRAATPRGHGHGHGRMREGMGRRTAPAASAAQRCRAARARREAALQRLGLKRRYAQLSQLDAELRADCPRY